MEQSNSMNLMSRESIINAVNMKVADIDTARIPMHVLPTEVQSIITDYQIGQDLRLSISSLQYSLLPPLPSGIPIGYA